MGFACPKCYKIFRDNHDLQKHINRKIPCDKDHTIRCDKCKREFSCKARLKYHTDHNVCKKLSVTIINNKCNINDNDINNNSGTINTGTIDNSINNSMNTTINNPIFVVPFGKEDYSKLSDKEYKDIIKNCFMSVPTLVSKLHCNKKIPEHHNIKKTNLRDNLIHVYDGTNWITKPLAETLEDLYDSASIFLAGKFKKIKPKLMPTLAERFMGYIENMDDSKYFKRVEDELVLILYNARNMINDTHKK